MAPVRLHPFHFSKWLRYGLVLCVFPVVRALLVFDIAAAWLAFTQSLAILVIVSGIAVLLWQRSCFYCTETTLAVTAGIVFSRTDTYRREMISATVCQRTLLCRLFGAAKVTVYFKSEKPVPSITLYLPRRAGEKLPHILLPAEPADDVFAPAGFDKLIFVMLSANIIATSTLTVMTVYRVVRMLGQDFESAARTGIEQAAHLFSAFLPAGVAALFALVFFFTLISVLRGVADTFGFTVTRSSGVLICRGGLITKTERRVLLSCVNSSSVHLTPWARLLRRSPVYVTAGGFQGHELPLVAVRHGEEETGLQRFLPEFCLPQKKLCNPRRRHLGTFIWKSGTLAGLALVLLLVSLYALPQLSWALGLLFFFGLCWCACDAEAFFREGICKNENRTFTLSYSRWFTRYLVSLYTNDLSLQLKIHPIAASEGRCDLRIFTPSHNTYHIRSVEYSVANRLRFNI